MALQIKLNTPTIVDMTMDLKFERMPGPEQSEIRATWLPAEWERQSGVQLTWPHKNTDWFPWIKEVSECYVSIALEISMRERLIIVAQEAEEVEQLLQERLPKKAYANIRICKIPTNDTWARDHGFITLQTSTGCLLLDFQFNGWGKKFPSELDNMICRRMMEQNVLNGQYEDHLDFVLEGGSIESDGRGTIMTTKHCLMAPNRNQPLSQAEIEERLRFYLHAERILWLEHGYLAGDDTDSHIDTLARFCSSSTIAYVQCTDPNDEHYEEMQLMEEQLRSFRTLEGEPYHLIPLPMARPKYDNEGGRLPATYANFLCINGAVLMPAYGDAELDERALRQLQTAFPRHKIIPINCQVLIEQHGSLHCCTMQFPIGAIRNTEN